MHLFSPLLGIPQLKSEVLLCFISRDLSEQITLNQNFYVIHCKVHLWFQFFEEKIDPVMWHFLFYIWLSFILGILLSDFICFL